MLATAVVRPGDAGWRSASALPGLVVAFAAVFALRRLDNTDTWWHLAGGRWIVQHHHVPATDPLSWTVPDHPWINVQWLFDIVLYGLWQLGGASLLSVLRFHLIDELWRGDTVADTVDPGRVNDVR